MNWSTRRRGLKVQRSPGTGTSVGGIDDLDWFGRKLGGFIDAAKGKEAPPQNTLRQHISTYCTFCSKNLFIEVHFRCEAKAILRYCKELHRCFWSGSALWVLISSTAFVWYSSGKNPKPYILICAGCSPSQIACLGTSCQLWEDRLPHWQMATCCCCLGTPWMKLCRHPKKSWLKKDATGQGVSFKHVWGCWKLIPVIFPLNPNVQLEQYIDDHCTFGEVCRLVHGSTGSSSPFTFGATMASRC